MRAICSCGQVHTGEFPQGVNAGVQYGPRAQAAMVHLNQNHAVSVQRRAALMKDFFDLPVSQAMVVKAAWAGADLLQPTIQAIGRATGCSEAALAACAGHRHAHLDGLPPQTGYRGVRYAGSAPAIPRRLGA
jgi:hypothetical protein